MSFFIVNSFLKRRYKLKGKIVQSSCFTFLVSYHITMIVKLDLNNLVPPHANFSFEEYRCRYAFFEWTTALESTSGSARQHSKNALRPTRLHSYIKDTNVVQPCQWSFGGSKSRMASHLLVGKFLKHLHHFHLNLPRASSVRRKNTKLPSILKTTSSTRELK